MTDTCWCGAAAFGAELYGAMGISRDDRTARAAHSSESLRIYGAPHAAFLFVNGDGGRGWPPMSAPTCRRCSWR